MTDERVADERSEGVTRRRASCRRVPTRTPKRSQPSQSSKTFKLSAVPGFWFLRELEADRERAQGQVGAPPELEVRRGFGFGSRIEVRVDGHGPEPRPYGADLRARAACYTRTHAVSRRFNLKTGWGNM